MNGFRAALKQAIDNSNYKDSYSRLAIDSGLGAKTLSNLLNDDKTDTSKHGPGLFAMARVCSNIGASLDDLAHVTPPIKTSVSAVDMLLSHTRSAARGQLSEPNQAPTPEFIMRLHLRSGGKLEGYNEVLEYCDLYAVQPDANEDFVVSKVGAKSLSAITMNTSDATILQDALNQSPPEFKKKLAQDYVEARTAGCVAKIVSIDRQMPNKPVRVKMDYIRVLASVTDNAGENYILNYSSLIL